MCTVLVDSGKEYVKNQRYTLNDSLRDSRAATLERQRVIEFSLSSQRVRHVHLGPAEALQRRQGRAECARQDRALLPGDEQIPDDAARPGEPHDPQEHHLVREERRQGGEGVQADLHQDVGELRRGAHAERAGEQEPAAGGDGGGQRPVGGLVELPAQRARLRQPADHPAVEEDARDSVDGENVLLVPPAAALTRPCLCSF